MSEERGEKYFQMNEVHEHATWPGGMLQTGPTGSCVSQNRHLYVRMYERNRDG